MEEVDKFFNDAQLEIIGEQNKLTKAELLAKTDLLNYLSSSIKVSQQTDEIESTIESTLLERLKDQDIVNEIPTGTLLKGLLELKRLRIEQQTGILGILNQKGFVLNQQINNGKTESEKETKIKKEKEEEPISKENFESAKKIYDFIQGIKDAEINEEQNIGEK